MACIRKRRGKWVVDYRDDAGVRRWITCQTRREADDVLAKVIPASRQPRQPSTVDANVTIAEYSERWLQLVAAAAKPLTVQSYRAMLSTHIVPRLGGVKIRALSKAQVKQFVSSVLTSGRLARSSVGTCHAVLRAMLNAARDDGVILTNPADRLAKTFKLIDSPRQRQERMRALDREQVQALLHGADATHRGLFLVLARTGLRLGEALGLQWGDLDLPARAARVERTWSGERIGTPKSGAARTIDLSRDACGALRRLRVERKQETLRHGWREIPPWVFCTEQGKPLNVGKVRRAFRRALKAAKLPGHFTPHSLRHSFASQLLQAGVSPAYVQRQLGHTDIRLTVNLYGRWLPLDNKAAVDALDERSGSKTRDVVAAGLEDRQGSGEVPEQVDYYATKKAPASREPGSDEHGAEGGTRTPTGCPTRPSNVRVCQFRHFGAGKARVWRQRATRVKN